MQIKFYEIQPFKRHSWISFTFSVVLDGVNEIETAVILHHLTSGRWQLFAGWDMVSQYWIMLTAKETSGEKHFWFCLQKRGTEWFVKWFWIYELDTNGFWLYILVIFQCVPPSSCILLDVCNSIQIYFYLYTLEKSIYFFFFWRPKYNSCISWYVSITPQYF